MSLSSCQKCYDDICTCGYKYRFMNTEDIEYLIARLQEILDERKKNYGS